MLEKFLPSCQLLLDKSDSLLSPTVRITQKTEIKAGELQKSVFSVLYGSSTGADSDTLTAVLPEFADLNVSLRIFDKLENRRTLPLNSSKIVIIGFINTITEAESKTLQNWLTLNSDLFHFLLVADNDLELPDEFSGIEVISGTSDLKDEFKVGEVPWASVVYQNFEVRAGEFNSIGANVLQKLLGLYSFYEALMIFSLGRLENLLVWDYEGKKEKVIETDQTVILDFWDDTCTESLSSPLSSNSSFSYFQVYAGSQTPRKRCRYGLGVQGFLHETSVKLRLIDIPTTVLINNGMVIWKGNRHFIEFSKLVAAFLNSNELEFEIVRMSEGELEEIIEKINEKIKEDGNFVDFKFWAQMEVGKERKLEEKYRAVVDLQRKGKDENERLVGLIEEIKKKIQNLVILREDFDESMMVTEAEYKKSQEEVLKQDDSVLKSEEADVKQEDNLLEISEKAQEIQEKVEIPVEAIQEPLPVPEVLLTQEKSVPEVIEPQETVDEVKIKLGEEIQSLKSALSSVEQKCTKKDETIERLRKTIKEHKSDSITALQTRVNSLVEEKVKLEFESDKAAKLNKELSLKIEKYKKIIESGDSTSKKRDSQLEMLINKTNGLKQEISNLKLEVQKKTIQLSNVLAELSELRQFKDAKSLLERQNRTIDELKKLLISKDGEVSVLKGLIKNLQSSGIASDLSKSPGKLPPIKAARTATNSQKYIFSAKSNFTSKSIMSHDQKYELDEVDFNKAVLLNDSPDKNAEAEEEERRKDEVRKREEELKAEEERLKAEENKRKEEEERKAEEDRKELERIEEEKRIEEERLREEERLKEEERMREEERLKKEQETEERERGMMEIEEKIRREEDQRLIEEERKAEEERIAKMEEEKRQQEEIAKKIKDEESKKAKGKGKAPVKPAAKTGAKKK